MVWISEVRAAVGIWDALSAGRWEDLAQWVMLPAERTGEATGTAPRRTKSPFWYFVSRYKRNWLISWAITADACDPEQTIDRETAARRILAEMTNTRLQGECSPYLRPRQYRSDSYTLQMAPKTLLGAIWFQFARLLVGEAAYRPCKVCSRPIELSRSGEGFRADKEFCSNACKLKDHRRKVREAKKLREDGRTVRQIARQLETTEETVNNWLAKRRRHG
jgi:hypothetical protein